MVETADSTPPVSLTSEGESHLMAAASVTAALAGQCPKMNSLGLCSPAA